MQKTKKHAQITADIGHLLARVCGWTDEAFTAIRSRFAWESFNAARNKWAMRARGVPYTSGGSGDADRQSASRTLREAEAAGWVLAERSKAADRAAFVQLTDAGDQVARQLCGHPSVMDGFNLCRRVAELQERHIGWGVGIDCGRMLVNECALADVDPDVIYRSSTHEGRMPIITIEEEALPALFRGWLIAHSDTFGRAWYELLPAGRTALETLPTVTSEDFVYDNAILGSWCEARTAARAFVNKHEEPGMEIGLIPVSASISPLRREPAEVKA